MNQQIDRQALIQILQAKDIESLSFSELIRLFQEEEGVADFVPDGVWQIDPRNGDRIVYHSSRAQRPRDNGPTPSSAPAPRSVCAICQGNTTGIIDVADLSEGFTFINKNLCPVLYPMEANPPGRLWGQWDDGGSEARVHMAFGLHFLQWTSSLHDRDWHNMGLADRIVVLQRLAALEENLLMNSRELLRSSGPCGEQPDGSAFVLIIKNYGRLVGGSLAHGHQQIALSNIVPRRICDNWRYEREHGETFSAYLLRENPAGLLIRDYGPAVLLVPYFMRRPYDMVLLVKDVTKGHLYELTREEMSAVAEGWHEAIRAMRAILPAIGRETAYSVVTHNGPGAGLYFEFLPYVQETGGFEHLGLLVCQGNPRNAVARIRDTLEHT